MRTFKKRLGQSLLKLCRLVGWMTGMSWGTEDRKNSERVLWTQRALPCQWWTTFPCLMLRPRPTQSRTSWKRWMRASHFTHLHASFALQYCVIPTYSIRSCSMLWHINAYQLFWGKAFPPFSDCLRAAFLRWSSRWIALDSRAAPDVSSMKRDWRWRAPMRLQCQNICKVPRWRHTSSIR